MSAEAVVLLEAGTLLPPWLDAELGPDSALLVFAERTGEGPLAFATRISGPETSSLIGWRARFAVLVCNAEQGRARTGSRAALLLALAERCPGLRVIAQREDQALRHIAGDLRALVTVHAQVAADTSSLDDLRSVA